MNKMMRESVDTEVLKKECESVESAMNDVSHEYNELDQILCKVGKEVPNMTIMKRLKVNTMIC